MQMLSELPRTLHRTPPASVIGMNFQMVAVAGDEASPPPAPLTEIGMNVQMIAVAGDEAYPPFAPSSSEIGMNVQTIAVTGDEAYPPLAPPTENGMNVQMIAVAGDEAYPPLEPSSEIGTNVQMFAVAGVEAYPPLAPPSEIRVNIPMLPDSGDDADRDPQLPRPVQRFMLYRVYASIPVMLGANIHVLADMMEPTTKNKTLIGVSMISLTGNVAATTWFIFRGEDLPNDDWKKISVKIIFVFTGTLTLYASFSTLAAHLFTLPGIVLCGVLAVGLGHSDDLKRLCKKFIATIKNAMQKIRELIA